MYKFIILILISVSVFSAEVSGITVADNDAKISNYEKLNAVQITAYNGIGAFGVNWVGLPSVSSRIRDKFEFIEIRLVNSRIKTDKCILFDMNLPLIFIEMDVDGSKVIFGPIVYDKKGLILTNPYSFNLASEFIKEQQGK